VWLLVIAEIGLGLGKGRLAGTLQVISTLPSFERVATASRVYLKAGDHIVRTMPRSVYDQVGSITTSGRCQFDN